MALVKPIHKHTTREFAFTRRLRLAKGGSHRLSAALGYNLGMKISVVTTRNGFPCTALNICVDTMQRLAAAYRAGTMVRMTYVDLDGITQVRDCYIETIRQDIYQMTIKHRSFGYRTVCAERILGVK